MKKIWTRTLFSFGLLLLCGCAAGKKDCVTPLETARQLIITEKAQCVLIKDQKIVYQEKGRGVSPLLRLYKSKRSLMRGGVIVDKVIGRAAAAIAICGKVSHVHGEIMSQDAVEFLRKHNITSSSTLTVRRILNRKRNGLCPLEQSVQGIQSPEKALQALEKKIAQLMKQTQKRNLKQGKK